MKKHLLGIIAAGLMLCLCSGALAGPVSTVLFPDGASEFVFLPSDDLFQNFKNAMPGDTLTQTIEIIQQRLDAASVRIYLRADPVDEAQKAFLDQLRLVVKDANTGEIYNAQASETAQLTQDHLLGLFHYDSGTTLTAELTIPKDLGNEFQSARGDVHWVFTAELLPVDHGDTGDWYEWEVWAAAAVMIIAALTVLLIIWRRRSREET